MQVDTIARVVTDTVAVATDTAVAVKDTLVDSVAVATTDGGTHWPLLLGLLVLVALAVWGFRKIKNSGGSNYTGGTGGGSVDVDPRPRPGPGPDNTY
jgi:LPXTG-motif cell wall-anchored protein